MSDQPPPSPAVSSQNQPYREVVIAGGGLIGLSIAMELYHRGIPSTVLETGRAMAQASTAAAGMLAAEDPHNPPAIHQLARYSLSLYPDFLRRIEQLSGLPVPLQTKVTIQHSLNGTERLDEDSLDPRQLAAALLAAVRSTDIDLREHCDSFDARQRTGRTLILAAGAWSGKRFGEQSRAEHLDLHLPVSPRKGQMLRVALPEDLHDLREVHRSDRIYIVPRTQGPQAGSALIGATVEDVGFDLTTSPADLDRLRTLAAEFLPDLANKDAAPTLESWAGLRPATSDDLPLIGRIDQTLIATGHFRNGILLAPATAAILADLIESKSPAVSLSAFTPARFPH
jgi:glycine oxidase